MKAGCSEIDVPACDAAMVVCAPNGCGTTGLCLPTSDAHALLCRVEEIPELSNPGRGVTVIKTDEGHPVMGFGVGTRKDREMLIVETEAGKEIPIGPERLSVTARGGKGHGLMRKTKVVRVTMPEPPTPPGLLN